MAGPTTKEILAARQAAEHTQTAAGAAVFVTLRTWQGWEYGTRRMPLQIWHAYLLKTGQMTVREFKAAGSLEG